MQKEKLLSIFSEKSTDDITLKIYAGGQ